jgi:hypothetical protein
MTKDD